MKVSEIVTNTLLVPVARARNLSRIGWWSGYMVVQFKSGAALWIYGPSIPTEEKEKLLRVPYPDELFTSNIKNKYRAYKVAA